MVKIFTQNCPKPLSSVCIIPEPSKCMSIIKGHLVPTRGIADKKYTHLNKPLILKDIMKPVSPERANEEAHFSNMKGPLKKPTLEPVTKQDT